MAKASLFNELCKLLRQAGLEIRVESFKSPPDTAGGFCRIRGKNLILLHSGASKPERAQALIEVVERMGLTELGKNGTDLSPELLARLNRRGQMPWPHRSEAPSIAKTGNYSIPDLRIVPPDNKLSHFTTMGVGGEPQHLKTAFSEADIIDATRECKKSEDALFLLGGGSNVVVSDNGVSGTVLRVALRGIEIAEDGEDVLVTAAAGENWHDFAEQMSAENLAGIECLGGIPGAVGATPIQNVGAYGQDVGQTIESVRLLDRSTLKILDFNNESCLFAYRDSVFKGKERDKYIVLAVTYRLKRDAAPCIRYGELSRTLEDKKRAPSLSEVFETVVELRRRKSMVLDPNDENTRSCGSFFVNAQVNQETINTIGKMVGEAPPTFPGENGLIKVPSAWLIEKAGLGKGFRQGPVGISTKHTLAIVAHEGALAQDIVQLAHHIREKVERAFSVRLVPEPHFWGFSSFDEGLPVITPQ